MSNFTEALDGAINAVSTKLSDNSITPQDIKILVDKLETLGDMVKAGLPFADADLADLPATLRAENDAQMADFLVDNPILGRYNSDYTFLVQGIDFDVSFKTGFFHCGNDVLNAPSVLQAVNSFVSVINSNHRGFVIFMSYNSNSLFLRRYNPLPSPWFEINMTEDV